jgi:hypothetical protein
MTYPRPRLEASSEREIEQPVFEAHEKTGWSLEAFTARALEVLTVLQERRKLSRSLSEDD